MGKYVQSFSQGNQEQRELLGGKGANLAEMTGLGLPVPPGFTITTRACLDYLQQDGFLKQLLPEIKTHLEQLEKNMGKKFGSSEDPLLISVRSGAAVSMPGMMDTILNIGLNDESVQGLARSTGDEEFALDCYRRLIQMYGEVVLGVPAYHFNHRLEKNDNRADWNLISVFKEIIRGESDSSFPQNPEKQLLGAVEAVFKSWDNRRARVYREANNIPHDLGTAVNVQSMVFGNKGRDCGTGVLFTRNPSTGEPEIYGEFLPNAQGEDVVAGIRTPLDISEMASSFPREYEELKAIADQLEKHYREVQDVEFTIEQGRLFILQTRRGERTADAAIKIATDMVTEELLTRDECILRVKPSELEKKLHRQLDPGQKYEVLGQGLPASPGAATGRAVFTADEAEAWGERDIPVILITSETTPDDIHGILAARGVLTARGGMTSHAAVVARGMGKPAVCGCESIKLDREEKRAQLGEHVIKAGDTITINGGTGEVIQGEAVLKEPELSAATLKLLTWADERRRLGVRANADNGEDARKALELGAQGIGLCRTEHMFMGKERFPLVRQLILSESPEEQSEALEKLLPYQQEDFQEILEVMDGRPVTVRLLDPPLHEFLPQLLDLQQEIFKAEKEGDQATLISKKELFRKTKNMDESNPMMGLRGCRLGIMLPALYRMQVEALAEAGLAVAQNGQSVDLEIMIPLVADARELSFLKKELEEVLEEKVTDQSRISCKIGTMIELPRACLTADEIAGEADFFSFGTNDLTQTTFGFSRDDAEARFLPAYLEDDILPVNPFITIDRKGVGRLIKIAVEDSRQIKPELKLGICGEHGGDPESIHFCEITGFDYVSCSPFRVPVARLAAAQASIRVKSPAL